MFLGNSKKEAALDVINYNHLTFDSHIKNICKKSGQKFGALLWITKYFKSRKKKLLFKYFLEWWNFSSVTSF